MTDMASAWGVRRSRDDGRLDIALACILAESRNKPNLDYGLARPPVTVHTLLTF